MRVSVRRVFGQAMSSLWVLLLFVSASKAQVAATTTTLSVTAAGSAVSSVNSGTAVTLTATVSGGNATITAGQVIFCDAATSDCTAFHRLGTVQVRGSGTAALKLIPGIGSHRYKAVFAGTPNGRAKLAQSVSSVVTLSVVGKSATTISVNGNPGNYTLTAGVTGSGIPTPSGTVSYVDTSNNNASLGTAQVTAGTAVLTLTNPSNVPSGDTAWSATTADFNGDGIPDLAVANYGDGTVSIYLGNGDGTFTQAKGSPIPGEFDALSIVAGDFNQDGIPDLAMETGYSDGTVTVLLGNGDGTFTSAPNSPITVGGDFNTPGALAVGDFNGDGIPDLVAFNDFNVISDPGIMTVLLGKGDGTFTVGNPVSVGSAPISVAVGDFNGDGIADLGIANFAGANVTILLGNGDGTFKAATNSPVAVEAFPWSIAIGDFNGDGITDLAVANSKYTSGPPGTVSVLLGVGDGTFHPAADSPIAVGSDPVSVVVGDFDGDGKADLATANNGDATATILLGRGDGTFAEAAFSPVRTGDFPQSEAVADFNGDGVSDLAVANAGNTVNNIFAPQWMQTATASLSGVLIPGTGQHLLKAHYAGDENYQTSDSPTISLTATGFTMTGTAVSVSAGVTTGNSSTITVTPNGGFTGNVTLTAKITSTPTGAQSLPTVSFGATSPVNITNSNAGTATLIISTTAGTAASLVMPEQHREGWHVTFGAMMTSFLAMLWFPVRKQRWRSRLGLLVLTAIACAGLVACGGGGNGGGGGSGIAATTAGTYTVTITGTSDSFTATSMVSLTVQ